MGKKVIDFLRHPIVCYVCGTALFVGWMIVLANSGLEEFEPLSFISGAFSYLVMDLTVPPMFQFGRWIRNKITRG